MKSYAGKFVETYDKIFASKQYDHEVDFILGLYKKYSKKKLSNILDIGCGTGTHSHLLSKYTNSRIIGFDNSPEMISRAKEKYNNTKECQFTDNISDITKFEYDMVISMFFVINHIDSLSELEDFFNIASANISRNGIFIFDCWNGVAVLRDPPKLERRMRLAEDNKKIITVCEPESDLLNSSVVMRNEAKIYESDDLVEEFSYTLNHTLWSPRLLSELVERNGFKILEVLKSYELDKKAHHDDYKIVYICQYER